MRHYNAIALAVALFKHIGSAAKKQKCEMCHWKEYEDNDESQGRWDTLEISCDAVPAHLKHGDLNGGCDSQSCRDLCFHKSCMDDYSENEAGECICYKNAEPTLCGIGATCDNLVDECTCDNSQQVFDVNHNCVSPCTANGINIHMIFHYANPSDYFDSSFGSKKEAADGLESLRSAYPELFALEGKDCWLNLTGLASLETPKPSRDKALYYENVMGWNPDQLAFEHCNVSAYEKTFFSPAGIYPNVTTDCPLANEFFQSLVSKRAVVTADHYYSSDLHRLELTTRNVYLNESCHTYRKDYKPGDGFYQSMILSFSISHSTAVVVGGSTRRNTQSLGAVWLANGNTFYAYYLPSDEFELDGTNKGILFPFVSDHHLIHNPAKRWEGDIPDQSDGSNLYPNPMVAKMYGHDLLPSLKTYQTFGSYAFFRQPTEFVEIVIKACA
jgi:hypothetical protein